MKYGKLKRLARLVEEGSGLSFDEFMYLIGEGRLKAYFYAQTVFKSKTDKVFTKSKTGLKVKSGSQIRFSNEDQVKQYLEVKPESIMTAIAKDLDSLSGNENLMKFPENEDLCFPLKASFFSDGESIPLDSEGVSLGTKEPLSLYDIWVEESRFLQLSFLSKFIILQEDFSQVALRGELFLLKSKAQRDVVKFFYRNAVKSDRFFSQVELREELGLDGDFYISRAFENNKAIDHLFEKKGSSYRLNVFS